MADSNKTIRFTIKTVTEGGEQVSELGVNVKDLQEMITATQKKADKGIRIGVEAIGIDAVTNMIGKLNNAIQDLASAYKIQEQAESKLAQSMRNSMGATEAEIQSINELCSAQQKLGVLGDEVQLQGAERLSTYLQTSEALKNLIPLMNDLTVKQYGMDASGENAAAAAAVLGKAMKGNVTALKRLGIEFSDSEKYILQYGSESEKTALLIERVGSKVKGLNSELSKTNSGKIKQVENAMGDLKEMAGQVAAKISPLTNMLAHFGNVALGVQGIIKTFNILLPAMSKATEVATSSFKRLTISMRGMLAATGVGLAIAALSYIIEKLVTNSDKAKDSIDNLTDAEKRALKQSEQATEMNKAISQAYGEAKVKINGYIDRVKESIRIGIEDKKLVKELNEVYGDRLGQCSTLVDWYDKLIKGSEDYCRQIMVETRVAKLKERLQGLYAEKNDLEYDENGNKRPEIPDKKTIKSPLGRDPKTGEMTYQLIEVANWEKAEYEDRLKEVEQNIEETERNITEAAKELELPKIEQPKIDLPKKTDDSDKLAKEQERLERERQKAKEDADKKILSLQSNAETEYIALMEDGEKKERAIINQRYFTKMAEIAEKEKELTELRIKEGKEGLDESEKELLNFARELAQKTRDKSLKELTPLGVGAIKTYDELSNALSHWNEEFNKASEEERDQIRKTIQELENLKDSFELDADLFNRGVELDQLKNYSGKQLKIEIQSVGLDGWLDKMNEMQRIMNDTTATDKQRDAARKLYDQYQQLAQASLNAGETITSGWNGIKGIGNSIQSLTEALEGQKSVWETLTSVIDSAIGVYQSVMQVMELVNTLSKIFGAYKTAETGATEAASAAKLTSAGEEAAASGIVTAANKVESQSFVELAAAQYMAAHASIPFAGFGIGSGFVASLEALMSTLKIPAFAEGGIVSGPTIGIMGEYAGASGNPEVVAPLDKLQSYLGETGPGTVRVVGETVIDGKKMVILFRNVTAVTSKSGKRTGIKI